LEAGVKSRRLQTIERVNKEVWLVLSLLVIAFLLNFTFASGRMLLGLYMLPTLGSAYVYGRRHATLTAFASVLIVTLLTAVDTGVLGHGSWADAWRQWPDIVSWGGILIIAGYLMGTLYDHKSAQLQELRETYHGVLYILRHFISKDKYTENHSYRVAYYASKIGEAMDLGPERLEDVRAAALLHDIGKLEVSRELLYKAARLTETEYVEMREHVERGAGLLEPVGGSLRRVIPIILAHHERYDGSGYHTQGGNAIPVEARVIAVADTYDALTSDRPYRKAMPPLEVREIIAKGAGADFDPTVVSAFLLAFRRGDLEIPVVVV
jgi:putative nucleotidyltransferase with HDIG domain